jgi:hypothetical protein
MAALYTNEALPQTVEHKASLVSSVSFAPLRGASRFNRGKLDSFVSNQAVRRLVDRID